MDDDSSCRTTLRDRVDRTPETVLISSLNIEHSPRLAGPDVGHVRVLAETESTLPPIVVQRWSHRVIDGIHRVTAARQRGHETIEVRYFDGTDEEAFVLAVELNAAHGLPLSLGDRTAAATRILKTHAEWSNRRIARLAGLSATTVGALRKRATVQNGQSDGRIGADGRSRPVSAASGRREAGRMLAERPELSLRQVARLAGVAPSTVQDVRDRLRAGEDVVPPGAVARPTAESEPRGGHVGERPVADRHGGEPHLGERSHHARGVPDIDPAATLKSLRNDPSIRFNESGRALLRLLNQLSVGQSSLERIVDHVPPHWAGTVAELIRTNAQAWTAFAVALEERGDIQDVG